MIFSPSPYVKWFPRGGQNFWKSDPLYTKNNWIWIFSRFWWFWYQKLCFLMKLKKKKKNRSKNPILAKNPKNTQILMFPYFFTLFFINFLICFFIECKILDFTNFLVPTFWKSDKKFVCNDFFIFLFFRYFEIIKFSHDSAFFEILPKKFELNYKF